MPSPFRWQAGRQGTGYDKMLLLTARWPLPFDSYLIRYPEGAEIPPHTDPVKQGRHYRLNIVLKASPSGGEFVCATPLFASRRIKLFRPDACEHSVTRVVGGSRYVLSIGWVLGRHAATSAPPATQASRDQRQMHQGLAKLIADYQASVREAVALMEKSGIPLPATNVAWVGNDIPQIGELDGGVPYYNHGFGSIVHLPGGVVDFDFGTHGEIDGFSASRLFGFAKRRLHEYGFTDERAVQLCIDAETRAGLLIFSGDQLYYNIKPTVAN